jgi:hypothetical protein
MFKKSLAITMISASMLFAGCASVPLASKEQDAKLKTFTAPQDKAGVYIYRNSFVGQALKKDVSVDGQRLGETSNKVYFYKEVAPGAHKLSTESEFSDNVVDLKTEPGKNYFVEQYIKMGVFVGGAGLKVVSEQEGKKNVKECQLAK